MVVKHLPVRAMRTTTNLVQQHKITHADPFRTGHNTFHNVDRAGGAGWPAPTDADLPAMPLDGSLDVTHGPREHVDRTDTGHEPDESSNHWSSS